MRLLRLFAGFAVAFATATLSFPARADSPTLEELLRAIPEGAIAYNGFPLVSYVDLRALERAGGVPTPASEQEFRALPEAERDRWQRGVIRWGTGLPAGLKEYAGFQMNSDKGTLDQAMGLDFFAIDRVLSFGAMPPHEVTILAGGADFVDPTWIDMGLAGRGFVQSSENGVSTWARFADGAPATALVDTVAAGDPFDADINFAERLGFEPGRVTVAHHWPDYRETLAAAHGEAPQARSARLLQAMFEAVAKTEGGDGILIQGWAQGLPSVGASHGPMNAMLDALANPAPGGPDIAALRERMAAAGQQGGPPLSAYPLVLFAEVGAGDGGQINAIAIPYPDPATAEMAAAVVADRLKLWRPCGGADCERLVSRLGGTVTTDVILDDRVGRALGAAMVGVLGYDPGADNDPADVAAAVAGVPPGEGGAVAVVAVHYPQPADGPDAVRGELLVTLMDAILRLDLSVLAVP